MFVKAPPACDNELPAKEMSPIGRVARGTGARESKPGGKRFGGHGIKAGSVRASSEAQSRMMNCPFCHRPADAFERESKDGAAATQRCPNCRKVVPWEYVADYATHPPVLFSMVGMTSHGKTTYLNSLKLVLEGLGREWPGFSKSSRMVGSFRHGRQTDPTRAGVRYEPEFLTLSNVPRIGGSQILMYDTGGENFNRVENIIQFVDYTLHSRCVVWLIGLVNLVELSPEVDPVEVLSREAGMDVVFHEPPRSLGLAPTTEDGMRRLLYVLGPEKLDEMLRNYRTAMLAQAGDPRRQSLVVVLTKGDYLSQVLEGFPESANDFLLNDELDPRGDAWERLSALSQTLREWLVRLGYHNFAHNAESYFDSVHYCVTSAYTPNMELHPTPRGVLGPLFWLWRLQRPAVWVEAEGRRDLFFSLVEALDEAPDGATIRFEAGHYVVADALLINRQVHLAGATGGGTTIEVRVETGDAIEVAAEAGVTFADLRIEYAGTGELHSLVHVSGGRFTATACEFVGTVANDMPAVKAAVLVRHGSAAEFRDCTFRRCQAGLALLQDSTGTIAGCTFQQNSNVGVMVRDQARFRIEECRAALNGIGIFVTSRGETIAAGCDLWKNQIGVKASSGAVVRLEANRCRESTREGMVLEDVTAHVLKNLIEKNGRAGLRLRGACEGEAQENSCIENGGDGILAADRAAVTLLKNECARNEQHGIHVKDVAAPECRDNTCRGNGGDGICVEQEAQPVLRGNTCENNGGDGISVRDGTRPGVERNACLNNSGYGLSVARTAKPAGVRSNTTRGNKRGDRNDDRTWW
jgi:parallel beta-helix repeat protein